MSASPPPRASTPSPGFIVEPIGDIHDHGAALARGIVFVVLVASVLLVLRLA